MEALATKLVRYRGFEWVVLPGVFEPRPNFGGTKLVTNRNIEMYQDKRVLDIGCGCGVRGIIAALSGANYVLATDVVPEAIESTKINARKLGVIIDVWHSNLFESISGRFDMIVAYLPSFDRVIVNYDDVAEYDPGLQLHRRLLEEGRDYLSPGGILHTTFFDEGNLSIFLGWVEYYGYIVFKDNIRVYNGEKWHFFDLTFS